MDARAPQDRIVSLRQLLEFEQHKLVELLRQRKVEQGLANGHPEWLEPDIRGCEDMILLWTERLRMMSPLVVSA